MIVEEILEFKGVPEDKRVPIVATSLQSKETTWWQQHKLTRSQLGKSKICEDEEVPTYTIPSLQLLEVDVPSTTYLR